MKKILSLTLALVMCLGLTAPAFAVDFSQSGVTVLPEPPKDAVDFIFVSAESGVPKEDAVYDQEEGKFYVESCTAVPADQAGYQTITLKVRAEMFRVQITEGKGSKVPGWGASLYDYYTGELFAHDKLSGNDTFDALKEVTYGGVTHVVTYKQETKWENGDMAYDAKNEREIAPSICYMTVTVTAPVTYDGMVFALFDRYKIDSSAEGGSKVNMYFRFGPKATFQAIPTNNKLTADGVEQNATVYKINGSNYFKIRDLAAILDGTEKQFEVGYDNALKSVTATTGKSYTPQGGELGGAASASGTATVSNDTIYVDGEKIQAEVYKIAGNNYFKLRDLGKALDFHVGYDNATKSASIDTSKPYSE